MEGKYGVTVFCLLSSALEDSDQVPYKGQIAENSFADGLFTLVTLEPSTVPWYSGPTVKVYAVLCMDVSGLSEVTHP